MTTYREVRERLFHDEDQERIITVKFSKLSKSQRMTIRALRQELAIRYPIDAECKVKFS